MKSKQFTALLLAGLLCVPLAGCGGETGVETTAPAETTVSPEDSPYDANGFLKDDLPSDLDFGGRTVSIYVRGDNIGQYDSEETGDIVDDAIFYRNRTIEERLKVDLNIFTNTTTNWGDRQIYMDTVRACVMSNDGTIDIASGLSNVIPALVQDGMFVDLLADDMKYVDFDKPWWPTILTDELSIGGKMYLASGDADLGVTKYMVGLFFNKKLIADYKLEDPYALVEDGKWTFDKLNELASGVYSDLNGNSKVDVDDRFGFILDDENHSTLFLLSSELSYTEPGADGLPVYNLGTEKIFDLIGKVSSMMSQEGFAAVGTTGREMACGDVFRAGRALFTTGEFYYAETYRDLEFDFGILPYPKYDEAQKEYGGGVRALYSLIGIPVTADKNCSAAVLEALASENYRSVVPTYFESALKVKYARDDASSKMFDIIRAGIHFDLGIILGPLKGANITTDLRQEMALGMGAWTSTWASKKDAAIAAMTDYLNAVLALE